MTSNTGNPRGFILVGCCLALLATAACSKQSGNKGLQHQFNQRYLAPIEPAALGDVAAAHRELFETELAMQHTRFLLDDIEAQWSVANNDRKRASLSQDSADKSQRAARSTYQGGRINLADAMKESADAEKVTADARMLYLTERRSALRAMAAFLEKDVLAKKARLELAKAEAANGEKIRPDGFDLMAYRAQFKQRSAEVEPLRRVAATKQQSAEKAMKSLELALRKQSQKPEPSRPVEAPPATPTAVPALPAVPTPPNPGADAAPEHDASQGEPVEPDGGPADPAGDAAP